MYLIFSGTNREYASLAESKRDGAKTSISYHYYLGRVIDLDKGIFHNKERGFYTFDVTTSQFGSVPESFVIPQSLPMQRDCRISVDFGDAYLVHSFLCQTGLMDVVDILGFGNSDTLHAMVAFYMLSSLANCDAIHWFNGSVARLIYPQANMTGQRISDFLEAIGTPERQMAFQRAYIGYVLGRRNPDSNVLIDSSGLPNNIHFPLTHRNIHNGKVSNEVRLIFVVQRNTGLPLFFMAVPGNIVDVSTLERVFLHLEELGINVDSCIIDAGYNSGTNLDLFYDDRHECKMGFITRVKAGDKDFQTMLKDDFNDLDSRENFVKYEDRFIFIKKKKVMVGTKNLNPAWLYLGLDCSRVTDEQRKLFKRAGQNGMTTDAVYDAMQAEGLFGILSGQEYDREEILPAYYQRQSAEQIFDFAKNYTKLLPLRTSTEATFRGHLLLSYIATCAVKLLQIELKNTNFLMGSRLECLRNQKCTVYKSKIVTDVPQKVASDTYKALGIICPPSIAIANGKLACKVQLAKKSKTAKQGKADSGTTEAASTKKRGRPFGSKNRKTIEQEASAPEPRIPKKRGRPRGAKNKATLAREAEAMKNAAPRKRGRPIGSKNRKKPMNQKQQKDGLN